jgi:hypothetical protein
MMKMSGRRGGEWWDDVGDEWDERVEYYGDEWEENRRMVGWWRWMGGEEEKGGMMGMSEGEKNGIMRWVREEE